MGWRRGLFEVVSVLRPGHDQQPWEIWVESTQREKAGKAKGPEAGRTRCCLSMAGSPS